MATPDSGPDAGLSAQETQQLVEALDALRRGDLSVRMLAANGQNGAAAQVAGAVNALADQLQEFALETSRLVHATAVEGALGARMQAGDSAGVWRDLTDSLNNMSLILAVQVRDLARVAGAVAAGDLSQQVTVAAGGEMAQLKDTFNAMIEQLQLLKDSVNTLMRHVQALNPPPEPSEES